jgi:hypothetical protein
MKENHKIINPISDELLFLLREGRPLYKVSVEPNMQPNKVVVFHFEGSGSKELPTKGDHNTFLDWWSDTGALIRRMRKLEELDQKFA